MILFKKFLFMNIGAPCRQSGLYAIWAAMGSPEEERRCVKLTRFKKMSSTPELDKYDDEAEEGGEAEEAAAAAPAEEEQPPVEELPAAQSEALPQETAAAAVTPPKPTYADKVKGVRGGATGATYAVLAETIGCGGAADVGVSSGSEHSEHSEHPAGQTLTEDNSEADEAEEHPPEYLSCGDQDSLHLSDVEDTHNSFNSTTTSSACSTSSSAPSTPPCPAPLDLSDLLRVSEDVFAQSPCKTLSILQVGGRCPRWPPPARPAPTRLHTWRAAAAAGWRLGDVGGNMWDGKGATAGQLTAQHNT